jgi:hypothetical protein
MYLKIAEEQDKKKAEILRTDTDQLLVFVSDLCWPLPRDVNSEAIVWFVLRHGRRLGRGDVPRSQAAFQSGIPIVVVHILPRDHGTHNGQPWPKLYRGDI